MATPAARGVSERRRYSPTTTRSGAFPLTTTSGYSKNSAYHIASDQSEQTESQASEKSEVLIGAAVELPDDATVLERR